MKRSFSWSFLPPRDRAALLRLGFAQPTPVQEACLPDALAGKSFLATAPTGTGKTLVYLLPIRKNPGPRRNLVLVPTRELGYQVSQMLQALDADLRPGLVLAVGGHSLPEQTRGLRGPWHTLVATPGRLLEILDTLPDLLRGIRLLVLDEYDRLLDMGFEEQVGDILRRLPGPEKRQTLLFSATDLPEARLPGRLDRRAVAGTKGAQLTERIFYLKSDKKKGELLLQVLGEHPGRAIVFVGNREKANHLNGLLRLRGVSSEALHGSRLQRERARAYQDFKAGKFRVLVATDLAARGLDVPEVDLIVNYDLPRSFKDYVHRSGRTARRSRPGTCLSFAGPGDYLELRNLEKGLGGLLAPHPGFAQREIWLANARRRQQADSRRLKTQEFIRREQGINPEAPDSVKAE